MSFERDTLVLPAGTRFEEHIVTTQGDVVVGDFSDVEFGFETSDRIFVGEKAEAGPLDAGDDVRIDLTSHVHGDVSSQGSVFLGERATIDGKLSVEGDLDVGDDVEIADGFEAKGWINIRSPIPVVVYMFIYLLQLMGQGRGEEVQRVLEELEEAQEERFHVSEVFLFIPKDSRLGLQESSIPGGLRTGRECRLLGNFQVDGHAEIGHGTELHGALEAGDNVILEDYVEVHGDLHAAGKVTIGNGCHVFGDVHAERVELKQTALVDGDLHAEDGIQFVTPEMVEMEEKVRDFETGREDVVDLLD